MQMKTIYQVIFWKVVRENQRDSLLDHIFSNEENMIENIKYLPSLGKSDHLILLFDLVTYVDRFTRPIEKLIFFQRKLWRN